LIAHAFSKLKRNIKLNNLRNIKLHNVALSDKNSTQNFFRVLNNTTSNHIQKSKNKPYGPIEVIKVHVKNATKYLNHSFVESPTRGDNIYRYKVTTCNFQASLALPDYYKFLNENDQVWVSPICHFGSGYGIVDSCQTCVSFTSNCDGDYNVLIIGTRKDEDAMLGWRGIETWK
jgi:hypothetical protein